MNRAAIYARYSSHAQNDESIEQQIAECERYAADHKLAVVSTFADRAITGRSDRRPEFQRMIRAAEAGSFDVVIAYKSNRIARNMLHALQYEARLDRCGVRLVYAREEFGDSATGRFMLRSMMNLNQFYSENLSEDVTRGMMDNARQCRVNGPIPFGFRSVEGKYAVDLGTAPIVREIFARAAYGEKQAEIAADLNGRHIPAPRGGRWSKETILNILGNERYTGVYRFGDVRIEDGVPAIVDKKTFDDAHRPNASTRRVRSTGVVYAMTGKLYCGDCLVRMAGESAKGKLGTPYYYYLCPKCGQRVRKERAEDAVVKALSDAIMSDATIDRLVDMVMQYKAEMKKRSREDELAGRLAETRRAKANILRAIEAASSNVQALADRLAELEAAESDLLRAIERERGIIPDVDEDMVRFYFEQFRGGEIDDPAYRRLLIDTFLLRAYLFPDHVTVTFSFDGADDGEPVSVNMKDGSPLSAYTNTSPVMVGRVFVVSVGR